MTEFHNVGAGIARPRAINNRPYMFFPDVYSAGGQWPPLHGFSGIYSTLTIIRVMPWSSMYTVWAVSCCHQNRCTFHILASAS